MLLYFNLIQNTIISVTYNATGNINTFWQQRLRPGDAGANVSLFNNQSVQSVSSNQEQAHLSVDRGEFSTAARTLKGGHTLHW